MNIDGLGPVIAIVGKELIHDVADLYRLTADD